MDLDVSKLKTLQKPFRQLADVLAAVAKPKLDRAEGMDEIDHALAKLPSGQDIGTRVEELRVGVSGGLKDIRRQKGEAAGPLLADFIRLKQAAKTAMRERDTGLLADRPAVHGTRSGRLSGEFPLQR